MLTLGKFESITQLFKLHTLLNTIPDNIVVNFIFLIKLEGL